jgi:hypothetical protein
MHQLKNAFRIARSLSVVLRAFLRAPQLEVLDLL